jgi:hypothetical protein
MQSQARLPDYPDRLRRRRMLVPVLKANFMQPVIQTSNNILVVDTGAYPYRYRIW